MDWNTKLQDIIDYVENHLQRDQEPIKQEEIAQLAGCSIGFFQKVFSYMYGISFAEYVRSRKLNLAGYDLKSTNLRVIDIDTILLLLLQKLFSNFMELHRHKQETLMPNYVLSLRCR